MNVWALEKEVRIKHFLLEVIHRYGENLFSVHELPEQYRAIGIFKPYEPELSAYIFTFAQNTDKYGIDLYYPIAQHNIVGENENLSLEQLFSVFNIHFDLVS